MGFFGGYQAQEFQYPGPAKATGRHDLPLLIQFNITLMGAASELCDTNSPQLAGFSL